MTAATGACSNAPVTTATTTADDGIEEDESGTPIGIIDDLPEAARVATGTGETRDGRSWIEWSTCGPGSRADEAAANGGRAAGWVLIDDLLADPGIAVGDHVIDTCGEAIGLLDPAVGGTTSRMVALAGQVLAAQLNLNIGAESCPAAEESVIAAQVMLASMGYDGTAGRADSSPVVADEAAMETVVEYLLAYNAGLLCQ